ncbi:helix-turn-helix domain-containing protein [Pseudomonas abyssi]|uniref:helix-turn-helix domain-containing protein n=1 Tax=Pseudomonas abyssi TaxID=170540 RepID=UPI003C79C3B9
MSMELMVKAMNIKVGNPLRKLVLIKLADNANDKGECWPSYQHIADQCEISKRSVMSHVEALCAAGILRKQTRKGPKGNTTNTYRLHLSGSANAAPHGAGDSLGGVQEIHQGGANAAPHGAGDSLGGSAGAAPRTSHSFEPVTEPVTEPDCDPVPAEPSQGRELVLAVDNLSDKPKVAIPEDMPGPKDQTCKTFKAWANYAVAYRKRYGIWPVWNKKTGGQFAQLVERLGANIAHHVAAYYLTINDSKLINACHSVNLLLAGAESYHTQWATRTQMNATTARQLERTQANLNAAQAVSDVFHEEDEANEFIRTAR